jgi:hypothetical protein
VTGGAGVTHGRQPAVCRRCKGAAASPVAARVPQALRARPAERGARPPVISPPTTRYLAQEDAPSGARRARAPLKIVKKVLTAQSEDYAKRTKRLNACAAGRYESSDQLNFAQIVRAW